MESVTRVQTLKETTFHFTLISLEEDISLFPFLPIGQIAVLTNYIKPSLGNQSRSRKDQVFTPLKNWPPYQILFMVKELGEFITRIKRLRLN